MCFQNCDDTFYALPIGLIASYGSLEVKSKNQLYYVMKVASKIFDEQQHTESFVKIFKARALKKKKITEQHPSTDINFFCTLYIFFTLFICYVHVLFFCLFISIYIVFLSVCCSSYYLIVDFCINHPTS